MAGTLAVMTVIAAACSSSPNGQSAGRALPPTTTTTSPPTTTTAPPTSTPTSGAPSVAPPTGQTTSPPASIAANCSSDVAGALHKWLKSLAAGSTVTLPRDGCYTVNEILHINHATGLTIIGNGATLKQTVAGQNGGTDRTECPHHPMLFLTRDTNLSISDLNLTGAFDGHNGGVHCEGYNGIELQGDTGVTLNKLDVSNIQGDGLSLQIPTAVKGNPLNTHINVTNSTWSNIGYDGLSIESANGVTISDDTFSNVHLDAIDFEVDLYSSAFSDPNAKIPGYAAQDNILVTRCLFKNFGVDWFTSQQGQVPGVQQQNVVLSDNTIDSQSPLMQVSGTPQAKTSTRHQNITLTITGNKMTRRAKSTSGGSYTVHNAGSAMTIRNVTAVTITGNTFPMRQPDGPYLAAVKANHVNGLTIRDNSFVGAYDVLHPGSKHNTSVTVCGNSYGAKGGTSDGSCK